MAVARRRAMAPPENTTEEKTEANGAATMVMAYLLAGPTSGLRQKATFPSRSDFMATAVRLSLAGLLLLSTAPAFAADISATSKIDAVAVYPDGATVTRIIEFEAQAGENTLVAQDFPLGLDQASIRLDASQ